MNQIHAPLRNLANGILFVLVVLAAGVLGYHQAGWSFGDAIYMVVLTIFSVGYREVQPVDTPTLRILTTALIVLGCTGMIFVTGALVQLFTALQIQQFLGIKRMKNEIDHLRGHVIVCGFGRLGSTLARDLRAGGARFVIIDRDEERINEARTRGYLCIEGEATDENVLNQAGIDRAGILASVLPDDAANVFITLSARSLNSALRIIARGELPTTENKLLHAGANQVVLPTHIGAERIAEMILYPETTRLIRSSEAMRDFERELHRLGLELEVVSAADRGGFTGLDVAAIEKQAQGSFLIVAVHRQDGSTITRPPADTRIEAGDGVVVIGRSGRSGALDAFAPPPETSG